MNDLVHKPVLIDKILDRVAPVSGTWLDGTFGAGGYSKALIASGAEKVMGVDRDPLAHELASEWIEQFQGRIELHHAQFSEISKFVSEQTLDGLVLDIGVSSMQLDIADRGFSFMRDGPLDMRMSQEGQSAADLCNTLDEEALANIIYEFGEERASRKIAREIVKARKLAPLSRTSELADICERVLPRRKPTDMHPATRTFQAFRIAVNRELDELKIALNSALSLLKENGWLVIVSFHSLEDRIVKNFFNQKSGKGASVNRYAPVPTETEKPMLKIVTRKPILPSNEENAMNPRARSAKLRIAQKLGMV